MKREEEVARHFVTQEREKNVKIGFYDFNDF